MLRNTLRPILLALCLSAFAGRASADTGVNLTIEGVRNANGSIIILVFDDAAAFERLNYRNAVALAEIDAAPGNVGHTFDQLTDGPYAIFLFHDENGDDDLNIEGGRFLEGVGASGAPNRGDNPDFPQASFLPGDITIQLHYDE